MQFLAEYGIFLAKALTIVIAIIAVIVTLTATAAKAKEEKEKAKLKIKKLNKHYENTKNQVHEAILSKQEQKSFKKEKKLEQKQQKNQKAKQAKPKLFVLDFHGDIRASKVNNLSEEITAILLTAKTNDEVMIRLESGGGMVNAYGLAASQLERLKNANIKLTIAVDKIAASGGYMMACIADHLIAAPFAIIGSIGVIAQLPNFHRWLHKHDVDFEMLTAGQYKRTLTLFGENTKEGRAKLQQDIEDTHQLFKNFLQKYRSQLDLTQVATGEHWFASQAKDFHLIDALQTSDDHLLKAKDTFDIFHLEYKTKAPLGKRIAQGTQVLLHKLTGPQSAGQDYL